MPCPPLCYLWFGSFDSRSTCGNCACCYLRVSGVLWCGYSTEVTNAPTRELTARTCALHHRTDCESTVHLSLRRVYSKVYGYPRTNGRGLVRPVPVPTCTYKGRGVSATEYIIGIWTAVHLFIKRSGLLKMNSRIDGTQRAQTRPARA